VIDFKNTVVINDLERGRARRREGKSLGFGQPDAKNEFDRMSEKVKEEVNKVFNPEFLNRLDDVIVFHSPQPGAHRADRRHPGARRTEAAGRRRAQPAAHTGGDRLPGRARLR